MDPAKRRSLSVPKKLNDGLVKAFHSLEPVLARKNSCLTVAIELFDVLGLGAEGDAAHIQMLRDLLSKGGIIPDGRIASYQTFYSTVIAMNQQLQEEGFPFLEAVAEHGSSLPAEVTSPSSPSDPRRVPFSQQSEDSSRRVSLNTHKEDHRRSSSVKYDAKAAISRLPSTEPLAAVVETQQQQIEQQQQQIDALRREQQEQQKLMAEMMQHQLDQPDTVKLLGTVVDLEQEMEVMSRKMDKMYAMIRGEVPERQNRLARAQPPRLVSGGGETNRPPPLSITYTDTRGCSEKFDDEDDNRVNDGLEELCHNDNTSVFSRRTSQSSGHGHSGGHAQSPRPAPAREPMPRSRLSSREGGRGMTGSGGQQRYF